MNKFLILLALLILSSTALSFADQTQQIITLKDGSQIKGELAGIDNGVYTIKTPIIGDVHVAQGDVASITNANAATEAAQASGPSTASQPAAAIPNMDQRIAEGQQQLMSDPQNMAIIQQMAQDPQIAQALSDPALLQAVTSHDYQALQSNPKIQELMSNPKMQELMQKLMAEHQQQSGTSQ